MSVLKLYAFLISVFSDAANELIVFDHPPSRRPLINTVTGLVCAKWHQLQMPSSCMFPRPPTGAAEGNTFPSHLQPAHLWQGLLTRTCACKPTKVALRKRSPFKTMLQVEVFVLTWGSLGRAHSCLISQEGAGTMSRAEPCSDLHSDNARYWRPDFSARFDWLSSSHLSLNANIWQISECVYMCPHCDFLHRWRFSTGLSWNGHSSQTVPIIQSQFSDLCLKHKFGSLPPHKL